MLLKELTGLNGVSGNEDKVREFVIENIKPYCDDITVDSMGSVIAYKKGSCHSGKTVMFCAHMDEVGFIVSDITDKGFVKFKEVGGIDAVGAGYEFADAKQTDSVDQNAGKAYLGNLTGVDDLGKGDGDEGCQQQGDALHQTHIAGGEADVIDQPVAQMGEVEVKGDEESTVDTAGQQHFLQMGILLQGFHLEDGG